MKNSVTTTIGTFVFVALAVLGITACGNNSSNGNPQGQAVIANVPTPGGQQCMRSASVAAWWTQYQIQPYAMPTNGGANDSNFCGCPDGTLPACSPSGMICLPIQSMNHNVAFWSWRANTNGRWEFHSRFETRNPYHSWMRERADWDASENLVDRRECWGRWGAGREGCMRRPDYRHPDHRHPFPPNFPPNGGSPNCSINSVAQVCNVMPGQMPTTNGMICQPLGDGSPYGVWVQF